MTRYKKQRQILGYMLTVQLTIVCTFTRSLQKHTLRAFIAANFIRRLTESKGRFPLPKLTARVDGCQKMHPSSRAVNTARELGPWTRVVETDLKDDAISRLVQPVYRDSCLHVFMLARMSWLLTLELDTWENRNCHTASSGGLWRHFYSDSETTAHCELFNCAA